MHRLVLILATLCLSACVATDPAAPHKRRPSSDDIACRGEARCIKCVPLPGPEIPTDGAMLSCTL